MKMITAMTCMIVSYGCIDKDSMVHINILCSYIQLISISNSVVDPQVLVVTTHEGLPEEFYGAKLIGSKRSAYNIQKFIYIQ